MTTTIKVVTVGLILTNIPSATPANEICDKVSAISDCLLKTKKSPNKGAITAIKNEAWKACCMNSWRNISMANPPFALTEYDDQHSL